MRADNVPGVVWLRDLSKAETVELLVSLARADPDSEIRAQALGVLAKLPTALSGHDARALIEPILTSDDYSLRRAALDYIAERKGSLRALLDHDDLKSDGHAVRLAAQLDLRRHPSRVLERFVTDSNVRADETRAGLFNVAARISRAAILTALRSDVRDARLLGVELIGQRQDGWAGELREIVIRDHAPDIRLHAVHALIDQGEAIDDELLALAATKRDSDENRGATLNLSQEVALSVYSQRSPDDLRSSISWIGGDGPQRYEAAGYLDDQMLAQVRRDLRRDFRRLSDAHRASTLETIVRGMEAQLSRHLTSSEIAQAEATWDHEWAKFVPAGKVGKYVLACFRSAGMRILAARGRPSDIEFARRFVDSKSYDEAPATLGLFERFGTSRDAPRVLGLVDRLYDDDMRLRAAKLALRLSYKKDKLSVLRALRVMRGLKLWAVVELRKIDTGLPEALQLLQSDDSEVRLVAAAVVWDALDPKRRDEFLTIYLSMWHYFNVVCLFDRRLYAPKWLVSAVQP